jgi:hypothetical protein
MRKKRIIPTLPVTFLNDPINKSKYQRILYESVIEGIEQSLNNNKKKFVMARVKDGKHVIDVEIQEDTFKTNLETVLNFYEQQEEYEVCSRALELLNQIK